MPYGRISMSHAGGGGAYDLTIWGHRARGVCGQLEGGGAGVTEAKGQMAPFCLSAWLAGNRTAAPPAPYVWCSARSRGLNYVSCRPALGTGIMGTCAVGSLSCPCGRRTLPMRLAAAAGVPRDDERSLAEGCHPRAVSSWTDDRRWLATSPRRHLPHDATPPTRLKSRR